MAGWNGSGNSGEKPFSTQPRPSAKKSPTAVKGVVAGLVVIVCVAFLVFVFIGDSGADEDAKEKGRSKIPVAQSEKSLRSAPETTERVKRTDGKAAKAVTAESSGLDAAMNLVEGESNKNALVASPITKHLSDQVLLMATTAVGDGDDMPPLPNNAMSEKDFRESLKTKIVIEESDSKEIKTLKQRIIDARQEMQRKLDEGMSVDEVLKDHERIVHENAATRKQVMDELREIIESGDVEGAKKYRTAMNIALEQMGIRKLTTPITHEELDAQKAARKARLLERREQMLIEQGK